MKVSGVFSLFKYVNYNLTSFLGDASRFSPIVIGLIGGALVNFGDKNS